MLLADPGRDFFSEIKPWMRSADLRFANLEGPISDQHGEVVKPDQPLVFTGPIDRHFRKENGVCANVGDDESAMAPKRIAMRRDTSGLQKGRSMGELICK